MCGGRDGRVGPQRVRMFITLCYVYMWVRFHRGYSGLIRTGLARLQGRSFTFCCSLWGGGGPGARAPDGDQVFLQLGDKTVYVTEPQVSAAHLHTPGLI